jgi:pyruvate kinase
MADLQGPKIRVGKFADGKVMLGNGQPFVLDAQRTSWATSGVGLDYKELPRDVRPGDTLLLNDGLIVLTVDACAASRCTPSSRSAASCPTTRASTSRAAA